MTRKQTTLSADAPYTTKYNSLSRGHISHNTTLSAEATYHTIQLSRLRPHPTRYNSLSRGHVPQNTTLSAEAPTVPHNTTLSAEATHHRTQLSQPRPRTWGRITWSNVEDEFPGDLTVILVQSKPALARELEHGPHVNIVHNHLKQHHHHHIIFMIGK